MVRKTKTISETEVTETTTDVNDITARRNKLIEQLRSMLMPKSMLKKGGSNVRVKYAQEKGYEANVQEINELGKQVGEADVSLGSLRGE